MLRISYWKIILCLIITLGSLLFALPTFIKPESYIAKFLPAPRVSLGLDLRGGAYILLEMQLDAYDRDMAEKYVDQIRIGARQKQIQLAEVKMPAPGTLRIKPMDVNMLVEVTQIARESVGKAYNISMQDGSVILQQTEEAIKEQRNQLFAQTIEIVRRRVDESGTREIDLQRQGDNYILLQVPGIQDPSEIKSLLGKTAKLAFYLVSNETGQYHHGLKLLPYEDGKGNIQQIAVNSRPIITGDMLVDAQTGLNNGAPIVTFQLNQMGAKLFGEASIKNIGRAFAIALDNVVISAPVIREAIITGSGQISGSFTISSANELALLLRAGALPVPLKIVEERSVGPSLGLDSIMAGTKAAVLGGILVCVFMFIFYYMFGMVANIALMLNLVMIIAILAIFNATLTMPGIAGIVLTLGMAVDANVLIFERIREELKKGRTPLSAIETGYKMAFGTIFDSNITTVLVGVILYIFGAGPVKGFAVTLVIGILCSMFTAVTITKLIIAFWFRKYKPVKLAI